MAELNREECQLIKNLLSDYVSNCWKQISILASAQNTVQNVKHYDMACAERDRAIALERKFYEALQVMK